MSKKQSCYFCCLFFRKNENEKTGKKIDLDFNCDMCTKKIVEEAGQREDAFEKKIR